MKATRLKKLYFIASGLSLVWCSRKILKMAAEILTTISEVGNVNNAIKLIDDKLCEIISTSIVSSAGMTDFLLDLRQAIVNAGSQD
jgi:hypothetical protein